MSDAYEEWQQLLADDFLFPHAGPTVLFIDDTELARIRLAAADAAQQFVAAVQEKLDMASGAEIFGPVTTDLRIWANGNQCDPPPVLPVLALSVLAASRMRSDANARSTNYYLRLAQTLMPGEEEALVQALRVELSAGAFLRVVEMWRSLHEWIEVQSGAVGTSTIKDHPRLNRIGYPLSQALVRRSDLTALTRFFQALDFTPTDVPDALVVLSALDIWTATAHNRLSETFTRALSDSEIRPLLGSVVVAHAEVWDGRVLSSDGKQRITIRLGVDLEAWNTRWLFPILAAAPESIRLSGGHEQGDVILSHVIGRDYYEAQGVPLVTAEHVAHGFRLGGTEYSAEYAAAPIVVLRLDPQTGAWSSVPGLLPFDEHLVAVEAPRMTEFQRVLEKAASNGWRLIPQRGGALLSGYAFFEGVRFSDGKLLETALAEATGLRNFGVQPAATLRPRLVCGLPIARELSSTHYLVGGEPDLLLALGADNRTVEVTLDGRRDVVTANGYPLELRRFFGRKAGHHSVQADGYQLAFTALDEGPNQSLPAGTGALGWARNGTMSHSAGSLAVVGALVATLSGPKRMFPRRGWDETWLLLANGRAESVAEPGRPTFLDTAGVEIFSPRFEVEVSASTLWIAQRRDNRWRLTENSSASSKEYDVAMDVLSVWHRACSDENSQRLWDFQLRMAGERT